MTITYTLASGTLPTSVTLNGSTGTISGTPSVAGTYNFVINASNGTTNQNSTSQSVVIAASSSASLTQTTAAYTGGLDLTSTFSNNWIVQSTNNSTSPGNASDYPTSGTANITAAEAMGANTSDQGPYTFGGTVSWSNGTNHPPGDGHNPENLGNQVAATTSARGIMTMTFLADTTAREVWVVWDPTGFGAGANARVTATLTDGSAAAISNQQTTGSGSWLTKFVYTANSTTTLVVHCETDAISNGRVALLAYGTKLH